MKLRSAIVQNFDTSSSSTYPAQVVCSLEFDAATWHQLKKEDALGLYYNRELSNFLFQKTNGLMPHGVCQVDDKSRASKGIKKVTVSFLIDWSGMDALATLGAPGRRYAWSSKDDVRFVLSFGAYHKLISTTVEDVCSELSAMYNKKQSGAL